MEKVIQRRANNGKEKHQKKENKYTKNPEEMLETDLKEEGVQEEERFIVLWQINLMKKN